MLRQSYYSGHWHTLAVATVSPTGGCVFTVRPTVAKVHYYRLVLQAAATHPAGLSWTVALHVAA